MASSAYDAQAVAFIGKRIKGITDFAVARDPFLKELLNRKRVIFNAGFTANGVQLFFNPSNGYLSGVQSIGDYQPVQARVVDNEVSVYAPPSNIFDGVAISKLQEKRNANMPASDRNFDPIANRLASVRQALTQTLSADLMNDGTQTTALRRTGKVMIGLKKIINSNTGSLYGVDRSTAAGAYLRSFHPSAVTGSATSDGGGVKPLIRAMNNMHRNLTLLGVQKDDMMIDDSVLGSNEGWDNIICDALADQFYTDCLEDRTRFDQTDKDGSTHTLFKKKPVIPSSFCTANTMYWLNYTYWNLECTEGGGKLFDTYGEDTTNTVRSEVIGGQHCLYCRKPSAQGRLTVSS